MSFGDAEKASRQVEKPVWKVTSILGEVKKNRHDTLKITRVDYAGKDLINLQIWRQDQDNEDKIYPVKGQSLSFNVELRDKVIEAISAAE